MVAQRASEALRAGVILEEDAWAVDKMATTDLIARYIEEDSQTSPGSARLRESGVEVWALVAQLPAVEGDVKRVADAYGIPSEAVEAALAYYRRHKELIDARIALNAA